MPAFPISPLSPELTLVKPIGSSESRLGPIPNVGDGIPGIGGITSVEVPGIGVLKPGVGTLPQLPSLSQPAPSTTVAPVTSPAPEVTPFPGVLAPQPTSTPTPGPSATSAPTPVATAQPTTTPVPSTTTTEPVSTPVPSAGQLQAPAQGSPYSTQPITTTQIPDLVQTPFTPTTSGIPVKDNPLAQTFGKYLKDAVSNYNDSQSQADNMIQRLATGDKVDIHDVTLALQKASITNALAIQVRNRLVEAYQEVMRMQM